jgi:hypothetical protein
MVIALKNGNQMQQLASATNNSLSGMIQTILPTIGIRMDWKTRDTMIRHKSITNFYNIQDVAVTIEKQSHYQHCSHHPLICKDTGI